MLMDLSLSNLGLKSLKVKKLVLMFKKFASALSDLQSECRPRQWLLHFSVKLIPGTKAASFENIPVRVELVYHVTIYDKRPTDHIH